jgi:hypothetical protein
MQMIFIVLSNDFKHSVKHSAASNRFDSHSFCCAIVTIASADIPIPKTTPSGRRFVTAPRPPPSASRYA